MKLNMLETKSQQAPHIKNVDILKEGRNQEARIYLFKNLILYQLKSNNLVGSPPPPGPPPSPS